jgi:hypothetical protein
VLDHITVLHSLFLIYFVLHIWTAGALFPTGAGVFLFFTVFRPSLGPTQVPIQCVPAAFFPGLMRRGHEADNSPLSIAKVKNVGTIPPLPHTSSWPGALLTMWANLALLCYSHPTYTHTNIFFSYVVCFWTEVCCIFSCVVSSVSLIVQLSRDDVWMEASLITVTTVYQIVLW